MKGINQSANVAADYMRKSEVDMSKRFREPLSDKGTKSDTKAIKVIDRRIAIINIIVGVIAIIVILISFLLAATAGEPTRPNAREAFLKFTVPNGNRPLLYQPERFTGTAHSMPGQSLDASKLILEAADCHSDRFVLVTTATVDGMNWQTDREVAPQPSGTTSPCVDFKISTSDGEFSKTISTVNR
jgi:hypothetical protein